MKIISNLIKKFTDNKAREVDEDIGRKREKFKQELERLELLAIEAKVRGRNWDDKRDSNDQPFRTNMGSDR